MNAKYVGDITNLPVGGGKFCRLSTVVDLASRRLAGWAIADHMRTELVIDALAAAEQTRGSLAGAVMHIAHSSRYTSRASLKSAGRQGSDRAWARSGPARTTPPWKLRRRLQEGDAQRPQRLVERVRGRARRLPPAAPERERAPPDEHRPPRRKSIPGFRVGAVLGVHPRAG
ncbi:DDE-type integrase/transposase/recombinase [Streptomyces zaomyceticus]|uniref:DDE-type integrase/transposase/recombinase n=1 Tax=Streptomyces zaomyceticus TaxID=68286 RepID=UPI003990CE96